MLAGSVCSCFLVVAVFLTETNALENISNHQDLRVLLTCRFFLLLQDYQIFVSFMAVKLIALQLSHPSHSLLGIRFSFKMGQGKQCLFKINPPFYLCLDPLYGVNFITAIICLFLFIFLQ
jgi:hypothetical protein